MAEPCGICHEELSLQSTYTLPECDHEFHTNCVMNWFRVNGTCPICRDVGSAQRYYPIIKNMARKKDAPKHIISYVKMVDRLEERIKCYKNEIESFHTKHKQFKPLLREFRKLNTKKRSAFWKVINRKRYAARDLNIKPITVVQKKIIKSRVAPQK